MTLYEVAPASRPVPQFMAVVVRVVRAAVAFVGARRAERARQMALSSLLEMDAHRLDDLGITPQDVIEAMNRKAW